MPFISARSLSTRAWNSVAGRLFRSQTSRPSLMMGCNVCILSLIYIKLRFGTREAFDPGGFDQKHLAASEVACFRQVLVGMHDDHLVFKQRQFGPRVNYRAG